MKQALSLLLAGALLVSLTGCGNQSEQPPKTDVPAESAPAAPEEPTEPAKAPVPAVPEES